MSPLKSQGKHYQNKQKIVIIEIEPKKVEVSEYVINDLYNLASMFLTAHFYTPNEWELPLEKLMILK